mgnify:CR=1 FL=1|jgi:hypothetical protein
MKQNCQHCMYAAYEGGTWSHITYLTCRRYPEELDKSPNYLCGEYKHRGEEFDFNQERENIYSWRIPAHYEAKEESKRLQKLLNKRNKQIKELMK